MDYFGLQNSDNAQKAATLLDELGFQYERNHQMGYHYFHFVTEQTAELAANEVSKVVDKSLEDGEW